MNKNSLTQPAGSTARRRYHRYFPAGGPVFFWLLFVYLVLGWFYPLVGWAALVCMLGPVLTSPWLGRWWCGHLCLRSNMYGHLLSRVSPHRTVHPFFRTTAFRVFVLLLIFTMFGVQMYHAWGDARALGRVFWRMILITNIVGATLALSVSPFAWCCFCPMGTLSAWLSPRKAPLPRGFTRISVSASCEGKCQVCARVCPLQLRPYASRGQAQGFDDPDCVKCGRCVRACPQKKVTFIAGAVTDRPSS